MKKFIESIKKLLYWFPIIWKDRDWDYYYIYEIIKHKLKAQAKHIKKNKKYVQAETDFRRMKICVKLIQRIQDDFYRTELYNYFIENSWWENVEGTNCKEYKSEIIVEIFDVFFKRYPLIYKRVMNGEGVFPLNVTDENELKKRIAMNISYINGKRAHKLLFKIMEENIQSWWD